jgi:alkylhydroperoxidase family enzyme
MARLPLVDPDGTSGEDGEQARQALLGVGGGVAPNVYRAIANHPGALEAFSAFGRVVYFDSSISPAQRELAYLTASFANNCHY